MRILVVDDHLYWSGFLQQTCGGNGLHEFEAASFGDLGPMLDEGWDLALVDIQLADWHTDNGQPPTGLDALEYIARRDPNLPCFLHSSSGEENRTLFHHAAFWLHGDQHRSPARARLLGATEKPIDSKTLRSFVETVEEGWEFHGTASPFVSAQLMPRILKNQYDLKLWQGLAGGRSSSTVLANLAGCSAGTALKFVKSMAQVLTNQGMVSPGLPPGHEHDKDACDEVVVPFAVTHGPFFYSRQAHTINLHLVSNGPGYPLHP